MAFFRVRRTLVGTTPRRVFSMPGLTDVPSLNDFSITCPFNERKVKETVRVQATDERNICKKRAKP